MGDWRGGLLSPLLVRGTAQLERDYTLVRGLLHIVEVAARDFSVSVYAMHLPTEAEGDEPITS